MNRYAVINKETGEVVNVIAWDGITEWKCDSDHYTIPHEDCARGDYWDENKKDFMRPLSILKAPEDEQSIAERRKKYEMAKEKLRSGFLVVNDSESLEIL